LEELIETAYVNRLYENSLTLTYRNIYT